MHILLLFRYIRTPVDQDSAM